MREVDMNEGRKEGRKKRMKQIYMLAFYPLLSIGWQIYENDNAQQNALI